MDDFEYVFLLGDIYGHTFFRDKNSGPLWETNKYVYDVI